MPTRWAVICAIAGDLRFISHHDLLRAAERIARRAKLPLHYSQGFNPRAGIILPVPRPVGVTSRDDRLLVDLDEPVEPGELCVRLNAQTPEGMTCIRAVEIPRKNALPPESVSYEMTVDEEGNEEESHSPLKRRMGLGAEELGARIEALREQDRWLVERKKKPSSRRPRRRGPAKDAPTTQTVDIRPMVEDLGFTTKQNTTTLTFRLVGRDSRWAKPAEVLGLLGLGGPEHLARLVRTHIADDLTDTKETQ